MAPTRVLVVIGSESGGTRAQMNKVVKNWEAKGSANYTAEVIEGKAVKSATAIAEWPSKYDVLLVATSSYGDGDPPQGLGEFFKFIKRAAKAEDEKPLAGMQHAVLGFGSSVYDSFQNCPRLTDKYLGECGSRRMAQRAELDEVHESMESEENQPEYTRWVDQVYCLLQVLPAADKPPVCDWTSPVDTVVETDVEDIASSGMAGVGFMATIGVGVAAAMFYMYA